MKKQITVILLSALILSGCASGRMGNPGAIMAGASIGGSLGGSIGGLIGDNNHGWRGGYRGSAIGNIVGAPVAVSYISGHELPVLQEYKHPPLSVLVSALSMHSLSLHRQWSLQYFQ